MLRNVYIEVIRWCLQSQVTVCFDNHWYDNSIYCLIVHLLVDIWAYRIALVKIPPENSLPLLENWPQVLGPVQVPPLNLTLTIHWARHSFSGEIVGGGGHLRAIFSEEWVGGDFPDASLNENILNVAANFS